MHHSSLRHTSALLISFAACVSCGGSVPPYVPPSSGPVATLSFDGRMFDDAGASFAVEEKEGCGALHRVQEPEDEKQFVRIPVPANKRIFLSVGYYPRNCYGAASFIPRAGQSYVLSNWVCMLAIKDERSLEAQPLERAQVNTWSGKEVCRNP